MLGNFKDAIAFCERGRVVSENLRTPLTLGLCEYYYGSVLMLRGEGRAAKEHFQNSIKFLEEVKFIQPLALAWSGLGAVHNFLGEPETGIKHLEKGLEIIQDKGIEWQMSTHFLALGIYHFESGNLKSAMEYLEKAKRLSRKNHEKHIEGKTLIWLGRIWSKEDSKSKEESVECFRQGVKILKALGTRPDLSMGYLFWGELSAEQGLKEKAMEKLKNAEKGFEEMEVMHWLGETRAILEKLTG